jgi:two-component system phosphate regulon sensor histidine kinase PhoR
MFENQKTYEQLVGELEQLKIQQETLERELAMANQQLEEATDTIEAIRTGEIDALVINGNDGHQIYTLKSADQTYRIFIEQMTQGAITINRNGIILYSNSQFARLVSQPLEKVIGQTFYNFILAGDKKLCKELIQSAWENILTKGELRLSAGMKNAIPVLLSLKTLNLDEGISLSIILTDLSGQKQNEMLLKEKNDQLHQAERLTTELNVNLEETVKTRTNDLEESVKEKIKIAEQLYKSQQQLSKILETMAEGVQIIDVDGKLIYANKMAQLLLGIANFDIIKGKYDDPNWEKFNLDGSILLADEHPIQLAMNKGKAIFDYEMAIKPPNKEVFYISMNAVPIYDENKQLTGGIGTFMDVTHRRKAIQQKDDFISVASHELKTPITSLKAAIQLLDRLKNGHSDGISKLIDQATRSMNKVSNLVEELLNASKITSGQMHIKMIPFQLGEVVKDSCLHIQSSDMAKVKFTGSSDPLVIGDPTRIEQVLVNFINNAFKYAPDSETIQIKIQEENGFAKLFVKDTGPGIEPQKLPHLFDRYYRVDDSGQQYSGLGLGLYIAAEIIKKHGGQIGAESELGKGSTFWFTLPLAGAFKV